MLTLEGARPIVVPSAISVNGVRWMIVFEERRGRHTLKIDRQGDRYRGVANLPNDMGEILEDDDLGRLKRRLRLSVDVQDPQYFGIEGAIRRFLSIFPEGFTGQQYRSRERDYKVAASARLGSILPLLLARGATKVQAASVQPVFNTGSLHETEAARIGQVLAGPTNVDFVRGAARFADGRYSEGLRAMEAAIRPYGRASWPMVTYLPWLWLPAEHVFLKPMASRDFASRTGHDFAHEYEATLIPDVYRSMLDLARSTKDAISRIGPVDMIDVQGFIWVVGRYPDSEIVDAA